MMTGGSTGPAVTVMVTSTVAEANARSLASTVTAYSSFIAAANVTPMPTVIWPSLSMSKEDASAPERR